MKAELTEGPQAFTNFEQFAKAVLRVPKPKKERTKKRTPKTSSVRKKKSSDRD
jgi:hypothetical protein